MLRADEVVRGARELTTFGEMLLVFRRAAGLTQEELAEAAGMAARSIRDLERGRRARPQRRTAQLLVSALGLGEADAAALLAAAAPAGRRSLPPTAARRRPACSAARTS